MQVEIVWSPLALERLREIHDYIAQDNPEAAERTALRIVSVVEVLKTHPNLGRAGAKPGLRELVIGGTPYIVLYQYKPNRVTIATIWHGAQRDEP